MEYNIRIVVHGRCDHYDHDLAKQQLNIALKTAYDSLSDNVLGHFYKEECSIDIVTDSWLNVKEWTNP